MEEDAEREVIEEHVVPGLGQERVHLREEQVQERGADERGRDGAEALLDPLEESVAPGRVLDAAERGAVGDEVILLTFAPVKNANVAWDSSWMTVPMYVA